MTETFYTSVDYIDRAGSLYTLWLDRDELDTIIETLCLQVHTLRAEARAMAQINKPWRRDVLLDKANMITSIINRIK